MGRTITDKAAAVIFWYDEQLDKMPERVEKVINKISVLIGKIIGILEEPAANIVFWYDRKADKLAYYGGRRFKLWRTLIDRKKVTILKHFAGIVIVTIGIIALFNSATGYEYSYGGRTLGVVKNQEDVERVLEIVSGQLSEEHEIEINIEATKDIEFKRVVSINRDIDGTEEVLRRLTYMQELTVEAYGIYIDGKRGAILKNKQQADGLLENILGTFSSARTGVTYENVEFDEKVTVKKIDVKLGNIETMEQAEKKLLTGGTQSKIHVVKEGETMASVAKVYNTTVQALKEENPEADKTKLIVGEQLKINIKMPLINVRTEEIAVYNKDIPFETKEQKDDTAYKGQNKVTTKGAKGEKEITAKVVRVNGKEKKREILKEKVIAAPVTQVILIGNKEIPPTVGDGKYVNPLPRGSLTSNFEVRWGVMHNGIDLAAPTGSIVVAGDGGTVVDASYHPSYGMLVVIDHQNGHISRYAHNSAFLVKAGDKVYQGQPIARVGSTGNSTGAHCHFEIEVNGSFVNPFDYIK